MKTRHPVTAAAALLVLVLSVGRAVAATNLVSNGGFDLAAAPLTAWTNDYRFTGNSWYTNNHEHVAVIPVDGPKTNVLRLRGTRAIFWGTGQGVKVDSKPIPYERGTTYRLSVWARTTTGPNARIYIEGYQWKPGIRPHANPDLSELRKVYRQGAGNIMYFGEKRDGPFSNPFTEWARGESQFPGLKVTSAAKAHLRKIRFLVVHIVAIDGHDGDLLVDDVALEKIDPEP